jgi:hypothetical protein
MRFVMVNDGAPRPQSFCAMCCEPIGKSYLRELVTRRSYCDTSCYLGRPTWIVQALQFHPRASLAAPQPAQEAIPHLSRDGMR